MNAHVMEKYAEMLVRVGVNLQPGQMLVIQSTTDAVDLTRAVVKAAFAAGARDVVVHYEDMEVKRQRALHCADEDLRTVPQWQKDSLDYYLSQDCCQIGLKGSYPHIFAGIDAVKSQLVGAADNELRNVIRSYIHKGTLQWTGTVVANQDWANTVYPSLTPKEAFAALEADLMAMVRVTENNDPIADWKKHCGSMSRYSVWLNEMNFQKLHITTELGTDITMSLVKNHIWTSAADMGESKTSVPYVANIPTEEIFTDPNCYEVNGRAVASRPLIMSGKIVKDFSITFENGLAVDCRAAENEANLRDLLFQDENTRRLGEVALVSKQSPITKMNRTFYNGLIDENAASHLAFGSSFPSNIKGGTQMSHEELRKNGVNVANVHCDFMIGTPLMSVVGTTQDGREVVIMSEGDFVAL